MLIENFLAPVDCGRFFVVFEMPHDLPKDYAEHVCLSMAAKKQRLPEEILWAIRIGEGGRRGTVSRNTDGSVDVGVMQINSIHFQKFQAKYGVKPSWLVYGNCMSMYAAAYILRNEINRTGDFWMGVGSYNSRTPSKNHAYQVRIKEILRRYDSSKEKMMAVSYKRFSGIDVSMQGNE